MINALIKLFFIPVFFVGPAAWFGFKFYSETQLIKAIDKYKPVISDYAEVEFGSVNVHITGEVSITKITLTPKKILKSPITIKRLTVVFPSILTMMKTVYDVSDGELSELPDSLRVQYDGIQLPLKGNEEFYTFFNDQRQLRLKQELSSIVEPTCGIEYIIGLNEFQQMGIDTLIDRHFWEYKYTPENQKMFVRFGISATNLYKASLQASFYKKGSLVIKDFMQIPSLTNAELTYQDEGLIRMSSQHCANSSGISKDAYINRLTNLPDSFYFYKAGIVPNEAMKNAYINFLKNPDTVTIKAHFPPNFHPHAFSVYDTELWVSSFSLTLLVNNSPVSPFEIITPGQFGPAGDSDDMNMTEPSSGNTNANIKKEWQSQPAHGEASKTYFFVDELPATNQESELLNQQPRDIPIYELPNHIGAWLEVYVEPSKRFSGELLGVERERLLLKVRSAGGSITMPIKLHRIKSIKVR
ncbi:hypothetical protein J7438_12975 [Thalassotalea sp. G20_0]|uniref:hypothetical protein n=1 Tax=Thalassotalea sp. G20_0 TaxID=2821093 RepID=UPI001ADB62FC|nr:hypothetical protein [Thalassotalea sp. G20_0]MBO9494991.1 hypothetical protein [Thalassotalea sp. G20_0]